MDPEVKPERTGRVTGRIEQEPCDTGDEAYVRTTIHVSRPCRPFVTAEGETPRCEENRGGAFYTTCEQCLACDVPHIDAPDLMAYVMHRGAEAEHCVFTKQPTTDAEIERVLKTLADCDICGIRYGGSDPEILRKLKAAGASGAADALRPPEPGA